MRFRSDCQTGKVLLILSGHPGAHLLSLLALLAAFSFTGCAVMLVVEVAAATMLVRAVYSMTRGPKPVLPGCNLRRSIRQVVIDEVKIAVGVTAAAFVLRWPVAMATLGTYLVANILIQCAYSFLTARLVDRCLRESGADVIERNERQVLIVGTGKIARRAADVILSAPEIETGIAGFLDYHRRGLWRYRDLPLIGHPDEAVRILSHCQIDAIFVAVEPEDMDLTAPLFLTAEQMGVPVCLIPEVYQPSLARPRHEYIGGIPMMVYRAVPENQLLLAAKGVIDKIGAACGLLLTLPVLLASALAIKLDSRGPVFFKQTRSGLNGKPFQLYKFRTMCLDAEGKKEKLAKLNEMSGPVFKVRNDPRVTRVGRFLRKTSLDELPQFLNVLKGDMSLVGPRPPLPGEVTQYEPWQRRKLSVKPGVTCKWQVGGRNNIDFEEWMRLDLEYIDNWSLWEDAKILAKTIPAVLKGSGAS